MVFGEGFHSSPSPGYVREVSPLELSTKGLHPLDPEDFGIRKNYAYAYDEPVKYGFIVIYFAEGYTVGWDSRDVEED